MSPSSGVIQGDPGQRVRRSEKSGWSGRAGGALPQDGARCGTEQGTRHQHQKPHPHLPVCAPCALSLPADWRHPSKYSIWWGGGDQGVIVSILNWHLDVQALMFTESFVTIFDCICFCVQRCSSS